MRTAYLGFILEVTDHDKKADDWVLREERDFEPIPCIVDNFV
jgi:hypothetical protein